ncbi:magnesium transporter MgtE [mine drainage metagenome]|uniref:Magnesium transporter MgtE n=1 Tax=mine drainage metagenome TaxID=410659 RepID=A0A1J5PZW1_9ZZZZ
MEATRIPAISPVAKRLDKRREYALARKQVRESLVSVAGLIGRPVRDQAGHDIGRLVDILVRHGDATYPPVSGLIVKVGPRTTYIDSSQIAALNQDEIRLSSSKINLEEFTRRDGESLLDADVIDHQIVDVDGMRVVRSSDLYLAQLDRAFRVVGVDVSFVSFLRRIFPGAIRRRPTPDRVLDWGSVASLAGGEGPVRTAESRSVLGQMRPADLADLIEDLHGREQEVLIDLLEPEVAADALEEMEPQELLGLMRGLTTAKAAKLLAHMEPDESAEVLRDLGEEHRESVLAAMSDENAKSLRELVEFDDDRAGGIMTTRMVIVHESQTVAQALALMVEQKERGATDGVVVVNDSGQLLDHVQILELVAAKSEAPMSEVIGPPWPTSVLIDTPFEEVIEEFTNNRGSSIVVVDEDNKPVGHILADDLVDALVEGVERRWPWQSGGGVA